MSNCSYLYIADRLPQVGEPEPKLNEVHINSYEIPLMHILLVSGNPFEFPSIAWAPEPGSGDPHPRCIVGEASAGFQRLEEAFALLPDTPEVQEEMADVGVEEGVPSAELFAAAMNPDIASIQKTAKQW